MKIRFACNSLFAERRIMSAVCGIFLLLTFFVTPPAKTQDRFSAAQAAAPKPEQIVGFTGDYVDIDVIDLPLADFFRMMADIGNINIGLDPAINGKVTLKFVKMPWDQIFDFVLKNYGLDKKTEGSVVRVMLKKTLRDEAEQEEELRKARMTAGEPVYRVKRLNYARASELQPLITDQKTARGSIVVDDRTNSLIITDLPEYVDNMFKLIELLDIPQPQVEIETRIVSATRNFARDIGVKFGFVRGAGRGVNAGGGGSDSPNISSTGAGDAGSNINVNLPARTPFGGIGIAVGNLVDTFLLDAAITAGESRGAAKMISQPKVIVRNNGSGVVNNGVRFPVPVISDNTTTIQFFDAALELAVTPQITYDSNILLNLRITNNKLDFGYTSSTGIPTIRTSETSTHVLVSDGGTTQISGVNVEDDSINEERVPGFASIPIFGNLFRRTGKNRETQEVLFFVTPRILK